MSNVFPRFGTMATSCVLPSQRRSFHSSAFATPSLMAQQIRIRTGNNVASSRERTLSRLHLTRSQHVTLPTGVNMEVIEVPARQACLEPSEEKPPLIFVHGSFHAAWCFRFFQPFFASHGFGSYAVSLRGAGNTDASLTSNPTVNEHILDLSALLCRLDLPVPPVVIGHSIGGFIVQKLIEQDSSVPFSAMILMSSSPPSGNSTLVRRIMFRDGFWKTLRITLGFVRRSVEKDISLCREMFFSPKSVEWFSEDIEGDQSLLEYMELFKKTSKTLDVKSLKNVVQGTGCLKGKVFVIGGSADSLVDVPALEETASFWEADISILSDAPHDIMLYSQWEAAATQILDWITANVLGYEKANLGPEKR